MWTGRIRTRAGGRSVGGVATRWVRQRAAVPGSPDTATEEETDTATLTRLGRPWNVVVHDDPVTLMSYVVEVFRAVFGYTESKSRRLMMEVHQTGRSIVWTGARERAEIYVSKLQGHHLLATLEQADGG